MRKIGLKRLGDAICGLSDRELAAISEVVDRCKRKNEKEIINAELHERISKCPHCSGNEIIKVGSKDDRKRYRCKSCNKTFNALTGTPLAGLHYVDKFVENAKQMMEGNTVRKTAAALGIHKDTAFRWRHHFLETISQIQPDQLSGIVEADETFFLESHKGQRKDLPRKAKKRGTPAAKRGLSDEQIPVLVARNRSDGSTLTTVLPSRKGKDIAAVLAPRIASDSVLLTDGATAYRAVARAKKGVEVRAVPANPKGKTKGPNHINNVNSYDHVLKDWMYRFCGVATKYLPHYLGWHRWMMANKGHGKARKFVIDAAKLLKTNK